MEDLIPEYKDTRKTLQRKREELKRLRDEKKEQRARLMGKVTLPTTFQPDRETLEAEIATLDSDMKSLGGMISDAEYILEWLETGRRPGNKRGIERLAAYQRERPVDPLKMQAYIAKTSAGGAVQAARITDKELDRIEFALGQLTTRERECYEMTRGNGLSFAETGRLLDIDKSTVQSYVGLAEEKLRHHTKQADLFDYIDF
ncbi:sigma factor-like helix-turn-helix DNA-binding protein [Paenibacillus apiarius]|uniref:Fis family transcriptional regulator n=1 Tax=Paenibacillus apiarius TaxID=46240 RepID=A0ABT4DVG6_9BACL|nr:sigma factor-like helix-turn-helix DNA-binding protein [Paenibacillus apiarius]MCY9513295.1 Fis family transcriptional regulator [Paenibacillus apiarius]MCY9521346.1 Fis family transcriptional regulator [Paenibacillus apiarius]MCY9555573.1 Fis family transcriptional regulator [Paenibacillus apiarius]MCY9560711.1 Fis family transcriptional regulator [Paenibacillus apiarius]MCY9685038.1 Fis family transcriptional regulator [Paenibacillus apiarius]